MRDKRCEMPPATRSRWLLRVSLRGLLRTATSDKIQMIIRLGHELHAERRVEVQAPPPRPLCLPLLPAVEARLVPLEAKNYRKYRRRLWSRFYQKVCARDLTRNAEMEP